MALIYKLIFCTALIICLIVGIRFHVRHKTTSTICCVAGKSGGHIIPCLTLAQRYKQEHTPDAQILFFSMNSPLDFSLLAHNAAVTYHIPLALISSPSRIISAPILALKLARAWCTSIYQLYDHAPSVVITTGGIVGIPVCLAARMLGIPIELYNLDAVPGKAARWIAYIAQTTHVCFTQTKTAFGNCQCTVCQYPVRFSRQDVQLSRVDACQRLGFDPHKKTILIIGGSQGSQFLNNAIKQIVATKNLLNLQIIHQTGAPDDAHLHAWYQSRTVPAVVFSYRDDIATCYAAADLIISRAGAGSLFEIAFFEKPSIIIPLEAQTTDHQVDNAYAFQAQYPNACTVIRQKELELDPRQLYELIREKLIASP